MRKFSGLRLIKMQRNTDSGKGRDFALKAYSYSSALLIVKRKGLLATVFLPSLISEGAIDVPSRHFTQFIPSLRQTMKVHFKCL
jgi:hypothetical protein